MVFGLSLIFVLVAGAYEMGLSVLSLRDPDRFLRNLSGLPAKAFALKRTLKRPQRIIFGHRITRAKARA